MSKTKKTSEFTARENAYRQDIGGHIESGYWSSYPTALRWMEGFLAFFAGKGEVLDDKLNQSEIMVLHVFARGVTGARPRGRGCKAISVFPPVTEDAVGTDGKRTVIFRNVRALPKRDIALLTGLSVGQVSRAVKSLRGRRGLLGLRCIDVFAFPNGISVDCGAPEQLCIFDFDDLLFARRHAHKARAAAGQTWTEQMERSAERLAETGPMTKPSLAPGNDAVANTGTGGE